MSRRARSSASTARISWPAPAGQVLSPIVHQQPPALEQVRPRGGEHQKLERQPDGRLSGLRRPAPSRWPRPRPCCAAPAGASRCRSARRGPAAHPIAWVVVALVHGDRPLSSTDRMRWRTSLAVAALTCQIGVRISSTSVVLTSETGRRPMRGKAYRSMLRIQFCACHPPRQWSRFCSSTRWAASANVGTPWTWRLSARGSPPDRASIRLAEGQLAGLGERGRAAAPSPSSRRRHRVHGLAPRNPSAEG